MIRRLIVPLTVAVVTIQAGQAFAQGAFPAPLPNQAAPSNASPFPPVNGAPAASVGAGTIMSAPTLTAADGIVVWARADAITKTDAHSVAMTTEVLIGSPISISRRFVHP